MPAEGSARPPGRPGVRTFSREQARVETGGHDTHQTEGPLRYGHVEPRTRHGPRRRGYARLAAGDRAGSQGLNSRDPCAAFADLPARLRLAEFGGFTYGLLRRR